MNKQDGHSATQINNNIYIFGGQNTGDSFFNTLYKIQLFDNENIRDGIQFRLSLDKISVKNSNCPSPRSSHQAVAYQNRYLVISGGENQSKKDMIALSDLWIFDTQSIQWQKVEIDQSVFKKRLTHSMSLYQKSLIIYGGMQNHNLIFDDLLIIDIDDQKVEQRQRINNLENCSYCKKVFNLADHDKNLNEEKNLIQNQLENIANAYNLIDTQITSNSCANFIRQYAQMIKNPFTAFGLLLSNSWSSRSNKFNIIHSSQFIKISDNSESKGIIENFSQYFLSLSYPIQYEIPEEFIKDNQGDHLDNIKLIKEYVKNLYLASFRLGNNFIYAKKNNKEVNILWINKNKISMIISDINLQQCKLGDIQEFKDILAQLNTNIYFNQDFSTHIIIYGNLTDEVEYKEQDIKLNQQYFEDDQINYYYKSSLGQYLNDYFLQPQFMQIKINDILILQFNKNLNFNCIEFSQNIDDNQILNLILKSQRLYKINGHLKIYQNNKFLQFLHTNDHLSGYLELQDFCIPDIFFQKIASSQLEELIKKLITKNVQFKEQNPCQFQPTNLIEKYERFD